MLEWTRREGDEGLGVHPAWLLHDNARTAIRFQSASRGQVAASAVLQDGQWHAAAMEGGCLHGLRRKKAGSNRAGRLPGEMLPSFAS
jgi:hypothetical protein